MLISKGLLPALLAFSANLLHGSASERFSEIPTALAASVAEGEIAGAVSLVADRDQTLHMIAVGASNLSTGRAMQTDDIFWIASMTKPIAAAAVAILVDDGLLAFDDPVEKFLPEFKNQWVVSEVIGQRHLLDRPQQSVTLRHLLTHTSGMAGYPVTDPHWTLSEMTKVAAREPLQANPGTKWIYSNAGIDALGRVVEVVSGLPYADFMQKRLFDVLEMKDTSFWLTPESEQRFAENYQRKDKGALEPTRIVYLYGGATTDQKRPPLGGAGLFSTAQDIAHFYQMTLNGGEWHGRRILKATTVRQMTQNQTGTLAVRPGIATGFGFTVITDPKAVLQNATLSVGTFGHGGAHGTQSWADPATGLIHILMIQRAGLPENSTLLVSYRRALANARTARTP